MILGTTRSITTAFFVSGFSEPRPMCLKAEKNGFHLFIYARWTSMLLFFYSRPPFFAFVVQQLNLRQ